MIFVTVGNATQGFPRLLEAVESCAKAGLFEGRPIFVQTGNNPEFRPTHCTIQPFLSVEEFCNYMERAELIICHGGCGTLLHALRLGKVPVAMPRRKKYNEHVNDHQVQLVQALSLEGKILVAYEPADLFKAVIEAREERQKPLSIPLSRMRELVGVAIEELIGRKTVTD